MTNNHNNRTAKEMSKGVTLLLIGGIIYGIGFGLSIADDNYIVWPFILSGPILVLIGASIIALTLDKLGIDKNTK